MSEAHRTPVARGSTGEDGLTIVELLIALVIVMIVFAGLAATMVASFSSIRNTEARVRAVALANELVEEMATAPWSQLGMALEADPDDNPDDFDGEIPVLLDSDSNPILWSAAAQPRTIPRDGHDYRVEQWVTWVEESGEPDLLKRVVAIVRWDVGGNEAEVRSDTLRAPDPLDVFELEVSTSVASTYPAVGSTAGDLHHKSEGTNAHRNRRSFTVTADLGVVESTVVLRFPTRNGETQTLVGAPGDVGESTRSWTIGPQSRSFPHGRTSFTVYATGPDGQLASDTATMRFYQPLEVLTPELYQAGALVSVVTVDATGQPCGDVTVEVDVEGMTSGEATADPDDPTQGGLRIRSPDDDLVIDEEMMGLVRTEDFGGRFIGEIDEVLVPATLPELPATYIYTFEVLAQRLAAYVEFEDTTAPQFDFQVEVVAACP